MDAFSYFLLRQDGDKSAVDISSMNDSPSPKSKNSDSSDTDSEAKQNYKTKQYYKLPVNVRKAIDLARQKSKHSDFYYELKSLNDKINVYT